MLSFNDLPISYSNCSAAGSRPVFEGKWTVISIIKKILTYLGNLDFFLNFKTKPIYNVFVVFFLTGISFDFWKQTQCGNYIFDLNGKMIN